MRLGSCVGYRGSYSRLCHGRASRQKILWAKVVRANEGCCLSPRLWPFFYLFAKIERLAAAQHGFGLCRVVSVLLMQHEPRQES
jgi:hypothetical protein